MCCQDEYGDGHHLQHDLPPQVQARGDFCHAPVHAGPEHLHPPEAAGGPPAPGRSGRDRPCHRPAGQDPAQARPQEEEAEGDEDKEEQDLALLHAQG